MKETLDTIGRAADTHQRIGAWFAALGCLVAGAVLFSGPEGLAEELPMHKEIGIGVGAFGLVLMVALGAKGKAASRAKNFVLFVAAGGVAAGLGFGVWKEARIVKALADEGEELSLVVERSTPRFRGQDNAYVELLVRNGDEQLRVKWHTMEPRGSQMVLLVHPDEPSWNADAGEGASLMEIADARGSRWRMVWMAAIALVAGLFALSSFWRALVGASAPDEED